MGYARFFLLGLLALTALLVSYFSAQADGPVPNRPDVRSALSTDIDLDVEALPPKGPPKLESSLWRLVEAERRGGLGELSAEAQRAAIELHDAAVRVVVEAQPGQASAVADAATLQGGVVETSYGDLVQVLAPVGSLEALSNTNGVRFVRQPTRYLPAVTGEGVALVNADDWHAEGITGSGVKVAVLDGGFSGYSSLLGSELPISVTTNSFRADGRIDLGFDDLPTGHGTAVAEIVHEMAPDAQLYLVNFQTDPEMANAVDWIVSQGIKVINASFGCTVCAPGDGTGFDNDVVTNSIAAGTQWAIAAGNEGEGHWMGPWIDANSDDWIEFVPGDEKDSFTASAGDPLQLLLKWDDPWGASGNDYGLCLFYEDAALPFICSENWQDGDDDPWEAIGGTLTTGGTYHIGIFNYAADGNANFHLYLWPQAMEYRGAEGSLAIPADNPDAITVGAVNWSTPDTIESFSGQGPTEDGRTKPDLVAPDYVSTVTYEPSGFPGTSAAAPHVAGAAALVKQEYPGYTPAQIKDFLEGRAVDLGAAGKDNIYGSGRLDLGPPPPPPSGPPFLGRLDLGNYWDEAYAQAEDQSELDIGDEPGESLTVEAWFYDPGQLRSASIVIKNQAYQLFAERYVSGSQIYGCIGIRLAPPSGELWGFSQCRWPAYSRGWHHVAAVFYKDTGQMRIYLDGAAWSDLRNFGMAINDSDEPLKVGYQFAGGLGSYVDELRISDSARYTGPTPGAPTAPFTCDEHTRALWHFDECDGATVFHDACGVVDNLLVGYNGAHSGGCPITLTVDSTDDAGDFSTADGVCDSDDSVGDGPCSLRAAIEQANATGSADTINFNIPGAGPHKISPGSPLPTITNPVIIDGTTEPDFAGTPIIELDGTNAGAGVDGLNITAGSSTVKGLVINRFGSDGIELATKGGNTIEGNYIGTDVTGTIDLGNSNDGVRINEASGNTIGGTEAGARNVISGNGDDGVSIFGIAATGNQVQGNLIGTDVTGTVALGNSENGVDILDAPSNIIGGTTAAERNVISGNGGAGVFIWNPEATGNQVKGNYIGTDITGTIVDPDGIPGNGDDLGNSGGVVIMFASSNTIGGTVDGAGNVISGNDYSGVDIVVGATGNQVQGNLIGTDKTGTADLGNAENGVSVWGPDVAQASTNTIGGTSEGASNTIAFNGQNGVCLEGDAMDNSVRGNSIHSNGLLGMDLVPLGELCSDGAVTPNDAGDGDTGPNNLQNFPVLTSATSGSTAIGGNLNSTPSTQFTIEFFSNETCDPSGYGEGETYLGSMPTDTTDENGDVTFDASFGTTVPAGHFITATATDPGGSTSEFSACIEVVCPAEGCNTQPVVEPLTCTPEQPEEGDSVTCSASFSDPDAGQTHTCKVDYGDGSGLQPGAVDQDLHTCTGPSHIYADDGSFTIEVCVTDDSEAENAEGCDTATVTIANVAPTVSAPTVTPSPSTVGQEVTASATFSDPGSADTHTCSIAFGDGSGGTPGAVLGFTCSATHTYTGAGTFDVSATVTDDDTGQGTSPVTPHMVLGSPPDLTLVGDFSGDGKDDVVNYYGASGEWWVNVSTGSGFVPELWATFNTKKGWDFQAVGDFNGDGKDDVVNYHPESGRWWVNVSTGSGFDTELWGKFRTRRGWDPQLVGDFNGDGKDDVVNYHPASGTWWVNVSTGSGFHPKLWGKFRTKTGWDPQLVGDFNGDGCDDVVNYHPASGTWWVNVSTCSGFVPELWATFRTRGGWTFQAVGDFNGDGCDDVVNYHEGSGTWWVNVSTCSGFVPELWATFRTRGGWTFQAVGDFNGDGKDDVVNYHSASGNWWVIVSTGSRFIPELWATFRTKTGWDFQDVGDFTGDGKDDVVNYHARSRNVWVNVSTGWSFDPQYWGKW